MASEALPPLLRQTANPSPVRAAGSVRRTCSIDVTWPEGTDTNRLFIGRARDYLTPSAGSAGRVLDEAEFHATLAPDKTILAITGVPADHRLEKLVGVRGGNHLRLFIKENMPEMIREGAPIYLPLDDISGTALVSAFGWAQWQDSWTKSIRDRMSVEEFEKIMASRTNICWGLKEGNSGLSMDDDRPNPAEADAGELRNPADPEGWHAFPEAPEGPGFRRARRIDVSRDAATGLVRIDASFQDSACLRGGGRVAIHEYDLYATVDPASGEILSLDPAPRILPFRECPGAVNNARRLIGSRIDDVRDTVLANLRGPEGCTHLNDTLRALAEVPRLISFLDV